VLWRLRLKRRPGEAAQGKQADRGEVMPRNKLVFAASPYLLQHKDNPVDWRMWGVLALEEARLLDKPILLSVGYSIVMWWRKLAEKSLPPNKPNSEEIHVTFQRLNI
jgi:Protein of unknown function, DUF255